MQNEFVLKAKTAIKRIAATAITATMMGATLFGAHAAGLADYPSPFVKDGKWVGLIVVGNDAAASDIVGATDIAATLSQQAVSAGTGGTTTTVGGITKNILLGSYIGNASYDGIDTELTNDDIKGLFDSSLTFQSNSYDYHDEIAFVSTAGVLNNQGPFVATSLASIGGVEDDYKDGVYLEASKGALGYFYVFDTTINASKATTTDPLEIDFLGKKVKITAVEVATASSAGAKFTAKVGQEVYMNVGDTATISGKTVKLINVGSSSNTVIVDVDGVTKTIAGGTQTVNGIEVNVDSTFYSDTLAERSATLVLGTDAVETYTSGDKFISPCATKVKRSDCKKENPDWTWAIASLYRSASGDANATDSASGTPTIGVKNEYTIDSYDDGAITVGGAYDFPAGGFEVRFDGLTVADTDYITITIDRDTSADISGAVNTAGTTQGYSGKTSVSLLQIVSSNAETLVSGANSKKTNKLAIWHNDSSAGGGRIDVFYRDPSSGKWVVDREGVASFQSAETSIGHVDYGDTKGINVDFIASGNLSSGRLNLTAYIQDDNSYLAFENITSVWANATYTWNSLGVTANSEEAGELQYNNKQVSATYTAIGTKDENHRTRYGVIIVDPKSNGASDRVKLKIPKDQVKAKISVVGPETTTTTTGGGVTVSSVAGVSVAKLDTEITDKTAKDMILVGGPAVNKLTAEALGKTYPTYGAASGIPEGKAMLKLVENAFGGTKTAVIVAGWAAENTRAASTVLKDFKSYTLSGKEMTVTGTGTSISVSAPTV